MVDDDRRGSGLAVSIHRAHLPRVGERMARQKLVVTPEKQDRSEEFQNLSSLLPYDGTIRFSTDGDVQISYIVDDKRQEETPENRFGLEKIDRYRDLDSAARGLGYVAERHDRKTGVATLNIKEVINEAQDITKQLQESGLTDEKMASMSDRAIETFVNTAFANSHSPAKIKVVAQTLKALSRDRRNAINPQRGVMIMSHLKTDLVRMLFKGQFVRNKNERRRIGVLRERAFERNCLEYAQEELLRLSSLTIGDGSFGRNEMGVIKLVHSLLSPRAIAAKPYSPVAAKARFLLYVKDRDVEGEDGLTPEERLATYVGEEKAHAIAQEKTRFELSEDAKERRKMYLRIAKEFEEVLVKSELRLNEPRDMIAGQPLFLGDET